MKRALTVLIEKEFSDATSSRWLLGFIAAFIALGSLLTLAGSWGSAFGSGAGFGRTSAALINLVLLIVPLMGLSAGALAFSIERERKTIEFLLTLPVRPVQIFWAKFLGIGWALAAALVLSFCLLAVFLTTHGGIAQIGGYVSCFISTLMLAAISLALGLLISAVAGRVATAVGIALLVWLALVFAGDLGLLGTSLAVRMPPAALLGAAWLNPLSLYRLLAIDTVAAGLDVLGPSGHCAQDFFGPWLRPAALAGLSLWLIAAVAAARILFRKKPLGGWIA